MNSPLLLHVKSSAALASVTSFLFSFWVRNLLPLHSPDPQGAPGLLAGVSW